MPNATVREIFDKSLQEAFLHCTFPTVLDYQQPFSGSDFTVHQVFEVITGIVGILEILVALYLIVGHLCNWCKPLEQKQQVRVIGFLIALPIIIFISTIFLNQSVYLEPVGQVYEGFAINAVFLLYLQIIMPDLHSHDSYFQELEAGNPPKGSPRWFRVYWAMVFQIIPIRILTLIAFEVLLGVSCPLTPTWSDGKTGLTAAQGLSTALAIIAIVQFERRMRKRHLTGHMSRRKLWSFKFVIILQLIQDQVFVVLAEEKVWIPSPPYYMSYNDFIHGLPQIIFMVEMLGTAILFLWAYEFKKYRKEIREGAPTIAGPVKAFLSCWDGMDMMYGIMYAFGGPKWMRIRALGIEEMHNPAPSLPGRAGSDGKSSEESTPLA